MLTGSRKWTNRGEVGRLLARLDLDTTVIVVGDCPTGLDSIVRGWCKRSLMPHEVFEADWRPDGVFDRSAGPRRNKAMVDSGVNICFAFLKRGEKNRGTLNAVTHARRAGVPVREIWGE